MSAHTAADLWSRINTKQLNRNYAQTHMCAFVHTLISTPPLHTQNHLPCLSHQPDSFSLLLFHIPLPDTNPGLKIPFKSTVCRLCFTGRLCYCVITHKQSLPPSLLPSLSPATPPPSLHRPSAVGAEPLIKSLRQKLLSSEYQVSAFRQEQH